MTTPSELEALSATGASYPRLRGGGASRPEQAALDVGAGFDGNEGPGRDCPDADAGGAFSVKGASLAFLYGVKTALHAHKRMTERTPFHASHADLLQRAVDTMALQPGSYHLPLRAKDGHVVGYAQFKAAEGRARPVLATVLAPHMVPGGKNIESMLKLSYEPGSPQGVFDTDQLDPRPPGSLAHILKHPGVGEGVGGTPGAYRKAFGDMDLLARSDASTMNTATPEPEL